MEKKRDARLAIVTRNSGMVSVWTRLLITDEPALKASVPVLILNCLGVVDVKKPFTGKTEYLSFQLVSGY